MAINHIRKSSNSLITREEMQITTILRDHFSLIRWVECNQHYRHCAGEVLGNRHSCFAGEHTQTQPSGGNGVTPHKVPGPSYPTSRNFL